MTDCGPECVAAFKTAHATWVLVRATIWLTVATFLTVFAALTIPIFDRRMTARREAQKERRQALAAHGDIHTSIEVMKEVHLYLARCLQNETNAPSEQLWRFMNLLHTRRVVTEHRLSYPSSDPDLPSHLATVLQGLYEVRDAVDGLLPTHQSVSESGQDIGRAHGWVTTSLARLRLVDERAHRPIPLTK